MPPMIQRFLVDFKAPLILIAEILFVLLWGDVVPETIQSALYAISLTLKSVLLFFLPFIIMSFLAQSIGSLRDGALSFIVLAFAMVIVSNLIATLGGGFLGMMTLEHFGLIPNVTLSGEVLDPLWDLELPQLISNDAALIAGLIIGMALSLFGKTKHLMGAKKAQEISLLFLKKGFIPLLPLFILGFIFKIQSEGLLESVFKNYLPIAVLIICVAVPYIMFMFAVAVGFDGKKWRQGLRRFVPAMLTGFTTMSSASTMPQVIEAVEANTKDPTTPGVVPVSINTHLVGDCFSMSIQSIAILLSFGFALPSMESYLIFAVFFVIARFAVAAVPGGGVLMTLPIFEKYLCFSPEMLSLITTLYILFDPLMTPVNVMGHGTYAQLFEKLYGRLRGLKTKRV